MQFWLHFIHGPFHFDIDFVNCKIIVLNTRASNLRYKYPSTSFEAFKRRVIIQDLQVFLWFPEDYSFFLHVRMWFSELLLKESQSDFGSLHHSRCFLLTFAFCDSQSVLWCLWFSLHNCNLIVSCLDQICFFSHHWNWLSTSQHVNCLSCDLARCVFPSLNHLSHATFSAHLPSRVRGVSLVSLYPGFSTAHHFGLHSCDLPWTVFFSIISSVSWSSFSITILHFWHLL